MKASLYNTCYGINTNIDGMPIESFSKQELIDIWSKMVNKKATKEVILNQINDIIENFGEETCSNICDECGNWNYDMEFYF